MVLPPQEEVLDEGHEIAARQFAVAVRFQPEARVELLAERVLVSEVRAPDPEAMLAVPLGVVVVGERVVVSEHQAGDLRRGIRRGRVLGPDGGRHGQRQDQRGNGRRSAPPSLHARVTRRAH